MTIAEVRSYCKTALETVPRDVLIILVLVSASLTSFGLGYLAGLDSAQTKSVVLSAAPTEILPNASETATSSERAGQVVASKNGTKYYPPGCPGASRISEANKVWFTSASAAVAAGYSAASGCSAP